MAGVSRAMLEGGVTRNTMVTMERELTTMVSAYLQGFESRIIGAKKREDLGSGSKRNAALQGW